MSEKSEHHLWSGTARRIRCFLKEEQAVDASEYAFMLGLIIVGLIGVIGVLGEANERIWSFVDTTISDSAGKYL